MNTHIHTYTHSINGKAVHDLIAKDKVRLPSSMAKAQIGSTVFRIHRQETFETRLPHISLPASAECPFVERDSMCTFFHPANPLGPLQNGTPYQAVIFF